jgi:hypothetical protein
MRSSLSIRSLAVGLALFASLGAGCKDNAPAPSSAPTSLVLAVLEPIPAPEGLVAEIFLPTPEASWAKARASIGAPAALLPQQFGPLAATLLQLPITLGAEIDGAMPAVGAAVAVAGRDRPAIAIALHVKAGDRFVDLLTKGEAAKLTARRDEATSIVLLEPKEGASSGPALGVLTNYVVFARDAEDLKLAAPYAVRSLPKVGMPKEDLAIEIPEKALAGPIGKALTAWWMRTKENTTQAVPALIAADTTAETLLTVVGEATHARATLTLEPNAAHLRLSATPRDASSKLVSGLLVGDAKPILELPSTTMAAVLMRQGAEDRKKSSDALADAVLKKLKPPVDAKDKEALTTALRELGDARGDWGVLGLTFASTGPTAIARGAVSDAGAMGKAIEHVLDLGKLATMKDAFKAADLGFSSGKVVVENLPGDVRRARFENIAKAADGKDGKDTKDTKDDKKKSKDAPKTDANGERQAIDLLTIVRDGAVFAAAGYDPKEGLRAVISAPTDKNLGSNAPMKSALDALGGESSFILAIDPVRLWAARAMQPSGAEAAPVVLAVGRSSAPASLYLRLDVANGAIQELIRRRGSVF